MKQYKKYICIALLLITAVLMFVPIGTIYDDRAAQQREAVDQASEIMQNKQNKLDRDGAVYNDLAPELASELALSDPEALSVKIHEIIEQRNNQNKEDLEKVKNKELSSEEITVLVAPELEDFLTGDLTYEKIANLLGSTSPVKPKDLAALIGHDIDKGDFVKQYPVKDKDKDKEEKVTAVLEALTPDEIMQIRTEVINLHYEIAKTEKTIAEKEEELEQAQTILAEMESQPMEELQKIALVPSKLPISERQDPLKKDIIKEDGKKETVDVTPEDVELDTLQIDTATVNKSNGYPVDGNIGNFHILTWIAFALLIISAVLIFFAGAGKTESDLKPGERIVAGQGHPSKLYTIASFANLFAVILIIYSVFRLQALPLHRLLTRFDEKKGLDVVYSARAVTKMNLIPTLLTVFLPIIALTLHIQSVHNTKRSMIYVFCTLLSLLAIVPFWIMIVNATRTSQAIQQGVSLIPGNNLAVNWNVLATKGFRIDIGFRNSAIIAFTSTILSVYFSAMTAYGFKVYQFKGNKFLYAVVLAIIMIPGQVTGTGFFMFMYQLGLTNNFIPLIIPSIAAAATVFFFRQYLEANFQVSLVEAARIDGCGEFRTFNKIVLPIMVPAMATMGIMAVIGSWNNYLTPLMLLSKDDLKTLPMLVKELRGDIYKTEYGSIYLGLAMTALPLIIVYLAFSKYIIAGVALGGVKE